MRVGFGYDVHRLEPGRPLILGGVSIPFELGLAGHSDADVVTHAVMDALLGAAALGDIGVHFPPTDEAYRNISSLVLLARVCDLVASAGWRVANVDATVVAERPKIAPYSAMMRTQLATHLQLDTSQISIKATTNEGLGAIGQGEGISAYAVTLLLPLTNT